MFYFFRHSSESSSDWCRHNIRTQTQTSVQDSLHPHSGWIEKSRVGLEYMLKRRSTYGPPPPPPPPKRRGGGWTDDDEGRDENVLCNFENQRCENLTSTDTTPLCLPSQGEFSTRLICLSGSARTEKTLGDRTSCWLLSEL